MSQWVKMKDQASGRDYFVNTATNEVSFEPPMRAPQQPAGPARMEGCRWQEAIDPSGRVYYLDHLNKTTTWQRPIGVPIMPANAPRPVPPMPMQQQRPVQMAPGPMPPMQQHPMQTAPGPMPPMSQHPMPMAPGQMPHMMPGQPRPVQMGPMPMAPVQQNVYVGAPVLPNGAVPVRADGVPPVAGQRAFGEGVLYSMSQPLVDANSAKSDPCAGCNAQFSLLKWRRACGCCRREFCDVCANDKAVLSDSNGKSVTVCAACKAHVDASDPRCISRVVPYVASSDTRVRATALRELRTLADRHAGRTPADYCAAGVVNALLEHVGGTPEDTASVCAVLAYCAECQRGARELTTDAVVRKLVTGAGKFVETVPEAADVLAAVAKSSPTAAGTLRGSGVLPVIRQGLSSSRNGCLAGCAACVAAVCAEEAKAAWNAADETVKLGAAKIKMAARDAAGEETMIMLALVPLLSRGDKSLRDSAISAIATLLSSPSCEKEVRGAFAAADGVKNVAGNLCDAGASAAEKKTVLCILNSAVGEDASGLIPHVDSLFACAADSGVGAESVQMRSAAADLLVRLCTDDAVGRRACEALLLDHSRDVSTLLASPDRALQRSATALAAALAEAGGALAPTMFLEAGAIPTLADLVRSAPTEGSIPPPPTAAAAAEQKNAAGQKVPENLMSAVYALKCIAVFASQCEGVAMSPAVAEPTFCSAVVNLASGGPGEWLRVDPDAFREAARALWALTGVPDIAALIAAHPQTPHTIAILVSSTDKDCVKAGFYTATHLCHAAGKLAAIPLANAGVLKLVISNITKVSNAQNSDVVDSVQASALCAMVAIADVDDGLATQIAMERDLPQAITTLLHAPSAVLCAQACVAAMSLCSKSDAFRAAFVGTSGLREVCAATTSGSERVQVCAARVLGVFATGSDADRTALAHAHGCDALLELLYANSLEARAAAVAAIRSCVEARTPASVVEGIIAAGGAVGLTALVAPDSNAPPSLAIDAAATLTVLMNLSSAVKSSSCEAGVVQNAAALLASVCPPADKSADGDNAAFNKPEHADAAADAAASLLSAVGTVAGTTKRLGDSLLPVMPRLLVCPWTRSAATVLISRIAADTPAVIAALAMDTAAAACLAESESASALASTLMDTNEKQAVCATAQLLTAIIRESADPATTATAIAKSGCLPALMGKHVSVPDTSAASLELVFALCGAHQDSASVILEPDSAPTLSQILANINPESQFCAASLSLICTSINVTSPAAFEAAVSAAGCEFNPDAILAVAKMLPQTTPDALSVLAAISADPTQRQALARTALPETICSILSASPAPDTTTKVAAFQLASCLAVSEIFRVHIAENNHVWIRILTDALGTPETAPYAVRVLIRLSVCASVRKNVPKELYAALTNIALNNTSEDGTAALALDAAAALFSITPSIVLSVLATPPRPGDARPSLMRALAALGSDSIVSFFTVNTATSRTARNDSLALPPPPPPEEDVECFSDDDEALPPPPPPPPPEEGECGCECDTVVFDCDLATMVCAEVADHMHHVGDVPPAYVHDAFSVLSAMCRNDILRGIVREHVPPEQLCLFAEAVPGFAYDAMRLADFVGSP